MLVIPEKDIVARNLQEQVAENADDIAGLRDDYEELKEQIDTQIIPSIPDSYLKYVSPNYSNGLMLGGIGDQDQTFKYFYVPVASASTTGVINTSAQSFGGVKTFNAGIKAYEISSLYGSEKIQPDKIMHWFQWLPGSAALSSIYSGNPYTISNATVFNSITACDRLEIGTSVPAGAIPGWDNGQILWTKIRGRGSLNTTMFSATINGSQYQFWLDRPNSTITFKKPGTYANYTVYTNNIAAATSSLMTIRSAGSIEMSSGANVDILSDGGTINLESHDGEITLNAGQGDINLDGGRVFVNGQAFPSGGTQLYKHQLSGLTSSTDKPEVVIDADGSAITNTNFPNRIAYALLVQGGTRNPFLQWAAQNDEYACAMSWWDGSSYTGLTINFQNVSDVVTEL